MLLGPPDAALTDVKHHTAVGAVEEGLVVVVLEQEDKRQLAKNTQGRE